MALDAEQQQVLDAIRRRGRKVSPKYRKLLTKAAIETGLVEENLHNRPGGEGTSSGWRQETKSSYPNVNRLDLKGSVDRFFNEAQAVAGKYHRAGDLAQAVQRSAFPDRYQKQSRVAQQLLKGSGSAGADTSLRATTKTKTVPGVSREADRKQLIVDYLQNRAGHDTKGTALLQTLEQRAQIKDTPASTKTVRVPTSRSSSGGGSVDTSATGTADFEGKKVAAWIAPILKQARKAGWTGKVESGYRSYADQKRIYNSGVRPAAKPGTSNHEGTDFPRGAVDVSNAAELAAVLKKLGISKLQWAGSKDKVHFSHPHGGSY